MIYATIIWKSFYRDGDQTRIELVSAMDENQFNTSSIPVPIETFSNNGGIDHLWVINSLISHNTVSYLIKKYLNIKYS